MRKALVAFLLPLSFAAAALDGYLETPAPYSSQSGIGVISGWHCTAKKIEVVVDGQAPIVAGGGTRRDDTLGDCGHSNTGFSLLFNWNTLSVSCYDCTTHTVKAYADGIEFGSSNFSVSHFGSEFMTGKVGRFKLLNFPSINRSTTVAWDENSQNFTIAETNWQPWLFQDEEFMNKVYYGAMLPGPRLTGCEGRVGNSTAFYGSFGIRYSNGSMSMKISLADGRACELAAIPVEPFNGDNLDGYVTARFDRIATTFCPMFRDGLQVRSNGRRLVAETMDTCKAVQVIAAPQF